MKNKEHKIVSLLYVKSLKNGNVLLQSGGGDKFKTQAKRCSGITSSNEFNDIISVDNVHVFAVNRRVIVENWAEIKKSLEVKVVHLHKNDNNRDTLIVNKINSKSLKLNVGVKYYWLELGEFPNIGEYVIGYMYDCVGGIIGKKKRTRGRVVSINKTDETVVILRKKVETVVPIDELGYVVLI